MQEIQETGTFPTLQKIATEFKAEETLEAAKKAKINMALAETQRKSKTRKPRKAQMVEVLNRSVRKLVAANREKHEMDLELASLMVGDYIYLDFSFIDEEFLSPEVISEKKVKSQQMRAYFMIQAFVSFYLWIISDFSKLSTK